ncbi:hypothetical protein ANO11243_088880 [Dothideomycetidae sp. 11243]|nr:hypothetical protein ANO11243_088880 [fungal sp. No.11243]
MQQAQTTMKKYDGKDGQPVYNATTQGHYELFTGAYANVGQGLQQPFRDIMNTYWQHQITALETEEHDFKLHQLPLARIKKVMKADPDVKMISAEAPIMFAKGCDIFITELTMRAWIHAEENKRRTLQRSDIATALTKSDMFDFLIDIVPRDEAAAQNKRKSDYGQGGTYTVPDAGMEADAGLQSAGQPSQPSMAHDFSGMTQHIPQEASYQTQPGMYPPPGPQGYQPPQMFDPGMYAPGYAMAQQTVSAHT